MKTPRRLTAVALSATLFAAGCQGAGGSSSVGPSLTPGSGALDLATVCPATVVIQAAWTPEAEHGALYHLLGETYTVDGAAKKVSGPLVAQGKDTGVKVEVRAGGPAIGFQNAGAQMYADPSIMLGQVATDDAIGLSAKQPVIAVAAPFDLAPYMIMWDPAINPNFNSIVDIGKTNTKVLYFNGATYMDFLTGSGILKKNQIDGSYDGSPGRFVAEGNLVQQGFATNEVYKYENDIADWMKPVEFLLNHDSGFDIYQSALSVRPETLTEYGDCLAALVPIFQQAQVDYVTDPGAMNERFVEIVTELDTFWQLSTELNDDAVQRMLDLELVSDAGNETLGDFDCERVDALIEKLRPVFEAKGVTIPADTACDDVVTNEFIDESISLG